MPKMDKNATKLFVKTYAEYFQDVNTDPHEEVELFHKMLENFPESADHVLDDLRRQELSMQMMAAQAKSQLLTYCQRQLVEMNQANNGDLS